MDDPALTPASTTGAPRWAKVFIVVLLVLALLLVVKLLSGGGGGHGPGRHSSGLGDRRPASAVQPVVAST